MCMVLYYLFARILIEKKELFSSQLDLLYVRLYYVTMVYDVIKFQIDLEQWFPTGGRDPQRGHEALFRGSQSKIKISQWKN